MAGLCTLTSATRQELSAQLRAGDDPPRPVVRAAQFLQVKEAGKRVVPGIEPHRRLGSDVAIASLIGHTGEAIEDNHARSNPLQYHQLVGLVHERDVALAVLTDGRFDVFDHVALGVGGHETPRAAGIVGGTRSQCGT